MFLRDLGAVLARRWYLALVCVALTIGTGLFAMSAVPTTYEMESTVVLLPPDDPSIQGENPLLELGGLSQVVDVLIRSLTADDVRTRLESDPPTADYVITPDFTSSAPLLLVTASGPREETEALLQGLLTEIPLKLQALQAKVGIRLTAQISSLIVTRDVEPHAVGTAKLRVVAVISVAALAVLLLITAGVDGLLVRRARKRQSDVGTAEDTPE